MGGAAVWSLGWVLLGGRCTRVSPAETASASLPRPADTPILRGSARSAEPPQGPPEVARPMLADGVLNGAHDLDRDLGPPRGPRPARRCGAAPEPDGGRPARRRVAGAGAARPPGARPPRGAPP